MQLFLGAVPIILRLFSKAREHLLFSNYSRNNLPKPSKVPLYLIGFNIEGSLHMQPQCDSARLYYWVR